jgi:FecR-like protein
MKEPAPNNELRDLPLVKAPDAIWESIEAAMDASLDAGPGPKRTWRPVWAWGIAAVVLAAVGAGAWWLAMRPPKPAWAVDRIDGKITEHGKIEVGDWLQTDASSRAKITLSDLGAGDIGTIEIAPNTRVRMVASRPGEQRLRLARGEISARVSAPPRLFFVDTPASTAVDLGCAYTMKADPDGNGLLSVTLGWVSLEWAGREALVPAGANCRTRPKIGPGTPYFDDASQALKDALGSFDFDGGGSSAADAVLAEARVRDTLTLWHLLSRVEGADRQRVYNRIVDLVPLPKGVSPDKALQLDRETLKLWREELAWKW